MSEPRYVLQAYRREVPGVGALTFELDNSAGRFKVLSVKLTLDPATERPIAATLELDDFAGMRGELTLEGSFWEYDP